MVRQRTQASQHLFAQPRPFHEPPVLEIRRIPDIEPFQKVAPIERCGTLQAARAAGRRCRLHQLLELNRIHPASCVLRKAHRIPLDAQRGSEVLPQLLQGFAQVAPGRVFGHVSPEKRSQRGASMHLSRDRQVKQQGLGLGRSEPGQRRAIEDDPGCAQEAYLQRPWLSSGYRFVPHVTSPNSFTRTQDSRCRHEVRTPYYYNASISQIRKD